MGRVNLNNALSKFENLDGAFKDNVEDIKPVKELAKVIVEPKPKVTKSKTITSSASSGSSEKKKYGIEADDSKKKVTLFLDKELATRLQLDTIRSGKSKSIIVEELLKEYF